MKKTHFYKGCSDIWIYNFDKIAKTNNYSYLVIGYDEYNEVKFDEEKARKLWKEIYNDFCKRSNDNTSLLYYQLLEELGYLKMRKTIALVLLGQLEYFEKMSEVHDFYITQLAKWNYEINIKSSLEDELKRMYRMVRFSDNKIGLMESEIDLLRGDEDESMSLVKQAVKLAQNLGKERINTKKTTVEEWLAMLEESKEINEYKRKRKVA